MRRRGLFAYSVVTACTGLVLVLIGLSQGQIVQSGTLAFLTVGNPSPSGLPVLNGGFSTDTGSGLNFYVRKANAGPNSPGFGFLKSRNAAVTPLIVQSGDGTGSISFYGYDGTQYLAAAQIGGTVNGSPSSNDMPGNLFFSTTLDGAAAPTVRLEITNTGTVLVNDLKTTGAATGKKVVCVDTTTGQLYASSTGTDCSN
jgi:hypothetical protein